MLWTDKYRPQTLGEVVGNKAEIKIIQEWVENWKEGNPQKPLLLVGPPVIGKMATNPFLGNEIPIFPASFVSASYGSGVVFSEPADAPADYIALQDLKKNDELIAKYNLEGIVENVHPIPVCTLKGYGEIPAADIIERLGITDQNDEKLHEATNELYKQQLKGH